VTEELAPQPRPLGELFADLASQTSLLLKKELELAKVEMVVKARDAAACGAQVAIGATIAFSGALVLLAALVMLLAMVLPLWAAALAVGAVVTGAGAALTLTGIRRLKELDVIPRQTLETLKDDKRWISEQVSR
jgi:hypothetical protein